MAKEKRYNERVIKSIDCDGDIIITDPGYVVKDQDWDRCDYGSNMEVIGINKYITNRTFYGDWSCTVWKASTYKECTSDNVLGEFCADTGLVAVLDWKECLNYNPELEQWVKSHDWCATIIKDFHGTVEMRAFDISGEYNGEAYTDTVLELFGVVGGKTVFIAAQTGL